MQLMSQLTKTGDVTKEMFISKYIVRRGVRGFPKKLGVLVRDSKFDS